MNAVVESAAGLFGRFSLVCLLAKETQNFRRSAGRPPSIFDPAFGRLSENARLGFASQMSGDDRDDGGERCSEPPLAPGSQSPGTPRAARVFSSLGRLVAGTPRARQFGSIGWPPIVPPGPRRNSCAQF